MKMAEIEVEESGQCDPREMSYKWQERIKAALKEYSKWHKQGDKIIKRFLDERHSRNSNQSKLNLFSANIQTLRSMLYGQFPQVDVKRRFADANDDVARVAAEILDRLLNTDIEVDGESYDEALANSLNDRLLPGLGVARVRYTAEFEETEVQAQIGLDGTVLAEGYVEDRKVFEDAITEYVNWQDFLWSPARVWSEVTWVAFRAYMTRDEVEKRFGEYFAHNLQYKTSRKEEASEKTSEDLWERAEVWEIWDRDDKMVYWWSDGCERILDTKEDPLELENFFPCPKPMFANLTTASLEPRPDFVLAQDQYNEIDALTQRINMLQKAVKAVGVYDKSSEGIQRMMSEAFENDLIPVDNWAMFAEKGGIQGQVAWLPIADIVNAMDKLREYRKEVIELLYQVTGMNDVMRGAQTMGGATATEYLLKSRFGSVRVQELQARFTKFAADLQRLKAEIICKHFDDQTIVQRANMQYTNNVQLIGPALQLLRNGVNEYRIDIESETMAMTDYGQLKSERAEYIQGLSTFLQTAAPMVQQLPGSMPFLLELLKWGMAGYKGSSQIESIMDQAIEDAKKAAEQPQQEQPDPQMQKEQIKMQQIQAKNQGKMQEIQMKSQAEAAKLQAETQADIAKLQAQTQADASKEATQARYNIMEEQAKTAMKAELNRQTNNQKLRNDAVKQSWSNNGKA